MITRVKIQGEGYLLNDELHVPKAEGNRHYAAIKKWLKSNVPEPEFTSEELLAKQEQEVRADRDAKLRELDKYQGVLAYNDLSKKEQEDLAAYRRSLLDAPETKVIPVKPSFFKE